LAGGVPCSLSGKAQCYCLCFVVYLVQTHLCPRCWTLRSVPCNLDGVSEQRRPVLPCNLGMRPLYDGNMRCASPAHSHCTSCNTDILALCMSICWRDSLGQHRTADDPCAVNHPRSQFHQLTAGSALNSTCAPSSICCSFPLQYVLGLQVLSPHQPYCKAC